MVFSHLLKLITFQNKSLSIQDFGLDYDDAAITKHLAKFLSDCKENLKSHPELKSLLEKNLVENTKISHLMLLLMVVYLKQLFYKTKLCQLCLSGVDENYKPTK